MSLPDIRPADGRKGVGSASSSGAGLSPQTARQRQAGLPAERKPAPEEVSEAIHARGVGLSVLQTAFFSIALGLLLLVVASPVCAAGLVIVATLALLACLHYALWGWCMPRPPGDPPRRQGPKGAP